MGQTLNFEVRYRPIKSICQNFCQNCQKLTGFIQLVQINDIIEVYKIFFLDLIIVDLSPIFSFLMLA